MGLCSPVRSWVDYGLMTPILMVVPWGLEVPRVGRVLLKRHLVGPRWTMRAVDHVLLGWLMGRMDPRRISFVSTASGSTT